MARKIVSAAPPRPPTWRLFFAISTDDLAKAMTAIAEGADVNHVDEPRVLDPYAASTTEADILSHDYQWRGTTPLTFASRYGRLEVVRLLLQHGARPDLRDRWNELPIEVARRSNAHAVVKLLDASGT